MAGSAAQHRRVVVTRRGRPDVLEVVEEALPEPRADEVRVRVKAAGVSAYDLMVRSVSFPGLPRPPFTPGEDIVGVVDSLGADVSTVDQGQTVAAGTWFANSGGYAEYACVPAGDVVPVPSDVDPVEAVCVVANYLTAHSVLHRTAHVRSGERVLVQGAAGGVGTALLDLGRLAQLDLYGTASEHNHERVAALGATPIDYRTEDVVARVRQLTGGGVDAVFDPIGGARQLWRSSRALRKGGRLVWFGVASITRQGMRVIPLSLLTRVALTIVPNGRRTLFPGNIGKPHTWYRETLAWLLDALAAGEISPLVAERIPLAEAARAHDMLERGGHLGKIVLVT